MGRDVLNKTEKSCFPFMYADEFSLNNSVKTYVESN